MDVKARFKNITSVQNFWPQLTYSNGTVLNDLIAAKISSQKYTHTR